MPNPKTGTVTMDIGKAISDVKATKNVLEIVKNNSSKIYKAFMANTNKQNLIESIKKRDPAAKSLVSIILTYPGVKAVFFHHISRAIKK